MMIKYNTLVTIYNQISPFCLENGTLEKAAGSGYGYRRTNTKFILITSLLLRIFYTTYETE